MSVPAELRNLIAQAKKKGDRVTREQVLEFARNHPDSAMYADFDQRGLWDDSTAAEIARLNHASSIIMRYKIVRVEASGKKEFRGLFHPDTSEEKERGYQPTEEFLKGEPRKLMIETIVRRCLGEMSNYPLDEFTPIRTACFVVLESLVGRRKAG